MTTATLRLKISPRRMLTGQEAADYCGLPIKKFSNACQIKPVQLPSSDMRYDIRDLDHWLDGLKSNHPDEDDEIIERLRK